jgi:F-type H+-transporting ATPase subunit b
MPQFDPSSFSSQLFWLAICFGLIYFSMSKIFLPRIRDILKDRHNQINGDESIALKIQEQIHEIETVSKNLRETSAAQYRSALEQSAKEAAIHKEQRLLHLKSETLKMVEKSKAQIAKFKQDSQGDRQKIIDKLVEEISKKFFENKINS